MSPCARAGRRTREARTSRWRRSPSWPPGAGRLGACRPPWPRRSTTAVMRFRSTTMSTGPRGGAPVPSITRRISNDEPLEGPLALGAGRGGAGIGRGLLGQGDAHQRCGQNTDKSHQAVEPAARGCLHSVPPISVCWGKPKANSTCGMDQKSRRTSRSALRVPIPGSTAPGRSPWTSMYSRPRRTAGFGCQKPAAVHAQPDSSSGSAVPSRSSL